jgi:hypothetical protein
LHPGDAVPARKSRSTAARNFVKRSGRRIAPRRRDGEGGTMKYLVLLIPCVIALWVPLFNSTGPEVFGVPFFYWFQLLLVPLSALAIYAVDRMRKA